MSDFDLKRKNFMMPGRALLAVCSFLFFCSVALADVSIEASVSRSRVAVGEELKLDIIVTDAPGRISKPNVASIDGFSSYSQGHSQEISIVNGQSSSRSIFSYVLIANSVGKKMIGPFDIEIAGRTFKIPAVQVEVVPDNGGRQPFPGQNTSVYPQHSPVVAPVPRALPGTNISNQDIYVKAWLDVDEVYVNEPATLTYTIYTRLSSTYKGFEKEPVTTGFWVEDFPPEKTVKRTEQIVNGSRYVVADIRKVVLFPTQAGIFTIQPGTIAATVELRERDDFNSFFSTNVFGRRNPAVPPSAITHVFQKSIVTDPVTLTVKALPEQGKPASFNGAVGNYKIESSIDKREVEEGNPVTFRIKVIGEGNINTLQTPSLPPIDGFKIYDSSSSANISKNRLIVEGEKVTDTVLVPKKADTYTVPTLSFSYFDPKTKTYKELKTAVHTLIVRPGPQEEILPQDAGVKPIEKEEVAVVGKDIRYIKVLDSGRPWPVKDLYRNPLYWGVNGIFVVWSLGIMLFSKKRKNVVEELKGERFRQSHKAARKRLKAAADLLKKNKSDEFYAEISRALYGYLADKLGISSQLVTMETIEERMPQAERTPEFLNQTKALFDELALGRFGKAEKSHEEMKAIYERADRVITSFEKVKLK